MPGSSVRRAPSRSSGSGCCSEASRGEAWRTAAAIRSRRPRSSSSWARSLSISSASRTVSAAASRLCTWSYSASTRRCSRSRGAGTSSAEKTRSRSASIARKLRARERSSRWKASSLAAVHHQLDQVTEDRAVARAEGGLSLLGKGQASALALEGLHGLRPGAPAPRGRPCAARPGPTRRGTRPPWRCPGPAASDGERLLVGPRGAGEMPLLPGQLGQRGQGAGQVHAPRSQPAVKGEGTLQQRPRLARAPWAAATSPRLLRFAATPRLSGIELLRQRQRPAVGCFRVGELAAPRYTSPRLLRQASTKRLLGIVLLVDAQGAARVGLGGLPFSAGQGQHAETAQCGACLGAAGLIFSGSRGCAGRAPRPGQVALLPPHVAEVAQRLSVLDGPGVQPFTDGDRPL